MTNCRVSREDSSWYSPGSDPMKFDCLSLLGNWSTVRPTAGQQMVLYHSSMYELALTPSVDSLKCLECPEDSFDDCPAETTPPPRSRL